MRAAQKVFDKANQDILQNTDTTRGEALETARFNAEEALFVAQDAAFAAKDLFEQLENLQKADDLAHKAE